MSGGAAYARRSGESPGYGSPSFREDAWRSGTPGESERPEPYLPTILHALDQAARLEEGTGITILPERPDGTDEELSYRRLRDEARRLAAGLDVLGVRSGDRVLLVLVDARDFLVAFFGTQILGALPVPAYPPAGLRMESGLRRLGHVARDAGARLCVASKRLLPVVGDLGHRAPCVQRIETVAEVVAGVRAPYEDLRVRHDDPAFLQYTSGSTDHPKGVVVTHDNLVCNVHSIGQAVEVSRDDALASWCPLYHDMGLIGGPVFCLYWRIPLVLMSPVAFLRRPERWLRAIHEHRITFSPAPNFGYALAVRRVAPETRQGLDLSSWRVALNGAETVNPSTVEAFVAAYGPHGFRSSAMMPVYGLAEATLAVTFPPVGTGARHETLDRDALARGRAVSAPGGLAVSSVGRSLPGQRVRIVGDEGEELPERRVGEVQVAGPNVMRGYWNDPESTAEVRDGPWLRTGDLGYLADGELFLTGRAKDLIILQGRNYHAEDLERSAEKIDDVRGGAAVAFAVYDQEAARERVVLVCECRVANPEERDRLATRIRMRVQEDTTVPVDEVVLVDRDTVPKTSSGKRQRSRCRELYLEGRLRPAGTGKLGLARLALRSLAGHLKIWVRRIMPGGRSAG